MAILEKLHGQGHTIIVVTHDSDIAAYARRIVRISDGSITSDEQQQKGEAGHQAQTGETGKDAKPGVAVLGEALKMALRSLLHNRLRTALTMLGIIIGVASVVALMAIGNGAKQDVLDRIQAMGTDLLTIMRGPPAVRASAVTVTSFLPEDLPSIGSVPGVAMSIPETNLSSLLRFGDQDLMVTAVGTGEDFPQVHDWPPESGVFFSAEHVKRYAQVVTLGQTVVKNLFPIDTNPLGQYVLIGSAPFLVIGVMSSKGLDPRGNDLDNSVWLPYTTAGARIFGQRFFNNIVVRVKPGADMSVVQAGLHTLLIKRHGKEDFNIRNMADTIATANETQNTLTYLLAAIAVISLVVGGIGVMNIMLVSVTERTREIGIRMAIGARSFDVLFQFLTEAVMVCFIGGLAGVMLAGLGLVFAVGMLEVGVRSLHLVPDRFWEPDPVVGVRLIPGHRGWWTQEDREFVVPVEITVFEDRSFSFILKTPPASDLLKKAAGIPKGSAAQLREKVGQVTRSQVRQIAELKMRDLNAYDVEAAMAQVEGTARSMGIEVVEAQ